VKRASKEDGPNTSVASFEARAHARAPQDDGNSSSFSRRIICVRVMSTTTTKDKEGVERRKAHPAMAVPCEGTAAILARIARLPALHGGTCPDERTSGLSPGRASREIKETRRRYPRRHSRLSGAPRTPIVMPEGTMPGPPGSGVTNPARRNRTRSVSRCVSRPRPSRTRFSERNENRDQCQELSPLAGRTTDQPRYRSL